MNAEEYHATRSMRGRLPLASSSDDEWVATWTGAVSDLTRSERFGRDLTTLHLKARYRGNPSPTTELTGEAGIAAWIISDSSADLESFGSFALEIRGVGAGLRPGAGLRGLVYLGESADGFSDRFMHLGEAELGFPVGPARGTAFAGIPLRDHWRDSAPFVLGVRFELPLGR
jgi:hypothetical protein